MLTIARTVIRLSILVGSLCLAVRSVQAADAPATQSSHRGMTIALEGTRGKFDGYLVKPQGKGPFSAVLVIQEWWGLNDQIRGVAERFAREGYVALAPDLYHGKVASDPEKAHELLRGLDPKEAMADLGVAVDYLRGLPEVGKGRIGSVGFCMGGGLSLQLALNRPDLSGAVLFYGSPESDPELLKKAACPILGLFGEDDQGIPKEKVEAMRKGLKEAGKEVDIHFYAKAGHAFFNETRPSYVPEAAADAWKRTLAFFRSHLKG